MHPGNKTSHLLNSTQEFLSVPQTSDHWASFSPIFVDRQCTKQVQKQTKTVTFSKPPPHRAIIFYPLVSLTTEDLAPAYMQQSKVKMPWPSWQGGFYSLRDKAAVLLPK